MNYKFNIIIDSSSNIYSTYLEDNYKDDEFIKKNVNLVIAPLRVRIGDNEFIDDDNTSLDLMLDTFNNYKGKDQPKSSCPSLDSFLNYLKKDEYNIIMTISSKLSGSYKNSEIAIKEFNRLNNIKDEESNSFSLDSKLVAGTLEILLNKLISLIKEKKDFKTIKKELEEFRDNQNLLFVLNKFDNLVNNGRMSKVVAFIATLANIKPLCYGEDGEIKVKEKIRTINGALKRLVANIGKMCDNLEERICIISHTRCEKVANELKKLIEETYKFKEVKVVQNKILSGFYSLDGGIICCF